MKLLPHVALLQQSLLNPLCTRLWMRRVWQGCLSACQPSADFRIGCVAVLNINHSVLTVDGRLHRPWTAFRSCRGKLSKHCLKFRWSFAFVWLCGENKKASLKRKPWQTSSLYKQKEGELSSFRKQLGMIWAEMETTVYFKIRRVVYTLKRRL